MSKQRLFFIIQMVPEEILTYRLFLTFLLLTLFIGQILEGSQASTGTGSQITF